MALPEGAAPASKPRARPPVPKDPEQRETVANPATIPAELTERPQWLVWRYEWKKDHQPGDKPTKVPYQARAALNGRRRKAKSTAADTWATFAEALEAYRRNPGTYSGVGFAVTEADQIAGVDLDNAVDPDTGELAPWAADIVAELRTYAEVSPSGEGVRLFALGSLEGLDGRKRGNVEMYDRGRYLTVTGAHLEGTPDTLEDRATELASVHAEHIAPPPAPEAKPGRNGEPRHAGVTLTDSEVLEAAYRSENGARIRALYDGDTGAHKNDHSAADLALVGHLAFFADYDRAAVDRLFRASRLYRAKWDERHHSDGRTYGEGTLDKAMEGKRPGDGYSRRRPEPARDSRNLEAAPAPGVTVTEREDPNELDERARPDPYLARGPLTDAGNAERLLYRHGHGIRYAPGLGWLLWDGKRWALDPSERILQHALWTMRATNATAAQLRGDGKELGAHARASERIGRLRAMVDLAATFDQAHTDARRLDADPWIINTESGLLDLRTAQLRPHDPAALCTKLAPVRFDLDAKHWAVDALLDLLDQDGRAEYLRHIAGQALTGRNTKAAYIAVGPSGTVKSTFSDALTAAAGLGEYAVAVESSTLTESRYGSTAGGARADLVALRGARVAIAAELPNGGKLSSDLLKRLTGRDPITARAPHAREQLTFIPGHTLLVHSNHEPRADWTDDGLRARLRVVPFHVRPDRPDARVRQMLAEDPDARAAFFAWAVVGAVAWHRANEAEPEQPDVVKSSTSAYWSEQDPFAQWAEDRLAFGERESFVSTKDLHANYRAWAEANGEQHPHGVRALGQWLAQQKEARGIEPKATKAARGWSGVHLKGPTG